MAKSCDKEGPEISRSFLVCCSNHGRHLHCSRSVSGAVLGMCIHSLDPREQPWEVRTIITPIK